MDVIERFMRKYPFEADVRMNLLKKILIRDNFIRGKNPQSLEQELKAKMMTTCDTCGEKTDFRKRCEEFECTSCGISTKNPLSFPYKCISCKKPTKVKLGTFFNKCECQHEMFAIRCAKCDHIMLGPTEELKKRESIECAKCNHPLLHPFDPLLNRKPLYLPTFTPKVHLSSKCEPAIGMIKKKSPFMKELSLSDKEISLIDDISKRITQPQSHFTAAELSLMFDKLLKWPTDSIFPVLDVFRMMLCHRGFSSAIKSNQNFAYRVNLILQSAFGKGSDWKAHHAGAMCLANNILPVENPNQPSHFDCFDSIINASQQVFNEGNTLALASISSLLLK